MFPPPKNVYLFTIIFLPLTITDFVANSKFPPSPIFWNVLFWFLSLFSFGQLWVLDNTRSPPVHLDTFPIFNFHHHVHWQLQTFFKISASWPMSLLKRISEIFNSVSFNSLLHYHCQYIIAILINTICFLSLALIRTSATWGVGYLLSGWLSGAYFHKWNFLGSLFITC